MISKLYPSPADAVADVPDGATVMVGGFGGSGLPEALLLALRQHRAKELRIVANNVGGTDYGVGTLIADRLVATVTCSFPIGRHRVQLQDSFWEQYDAGSLRVELVPQGSLAERIRAGGAGIPAFYTPTAAGTDLAAGKELREFDGRAHVLERALRADYALVKAWKADRLGNLVYRKAMRNFNPMMAAAATITIAQVAEVVEAGGLDPELIVTPGVYVQRVVVVSDGKRTLQT